MHIAFIDSICNPEHPGVGGLSDINWCLARELARVGQRVTVVGAYRDAVEPPFPGIDLVSVPRAVVDRNNLARHVLRTLRLARAAGRLTAVDVYHVPDSVTAAGLCILGLGRRTVWHGHSNVYHHTRHGMPWDRSMYELMRLATCVASRRVGRVISLGPSLVPWWERAGFSRDQICVIPNGIDAQPPVRQTPAWEIPLVWRVNRHRILYVGRLSAEKGGYAQLLDAVEAVRDLSVGLLLIGDGKLRTELERTIQDRGLGAHASCAGQQPQEVVRAAYALADLVVLPSQGEMLPRVMLEAWSAGAPFMATAVGAIPDYLTDQVNGFLLSSLERDYLRQKLRSVLLDQAGRRRVSQCGLETACMMSWERLLPRYQQVYQSLLAECS